MLDIAQNSLSANADLVEIFVFAESAEGMLHVSVRDNGKGMAEDVRQSVLNPFFTSRSTRKVGLGIPFFKESAEGCGGSFFLNSALGEGTHIGASYRLNHIDRPPLGDMAETMLGLVVCNEAVDFILHYRRDEAEFTFDTRAIRGALGEEVPFSAPEVIEWLKGYLSEGIQQVNGGMDV